MIQKPLKTFNLFQKPLKTFSFLQTIEICNGLFKIIEIDAEFFSLPDYVLRTGLGGTNKDGSFYWAQIRMVKSD